MDQIIVTVMRQRLRGHRELTVFDVLVETATGSWPESFGSQEQLVAFLKGVQVALVQTDWTAHMLSWQYSDTSLEPSGVRFTVKKDEPTAIEQLRADGSVVEL